MHTDALNTDPDSCPPEVKPRPMKAIYISFELRRVASYGPFVYLSLLQGVIFRDFLASFPGQQKQTGNETKCMCLLCIRTSVAYKGHLLSVLVSAHRVQLCLSSCKALAVLYAIASDDTLRASCLKW